MWLASSTYGQLVDSEHSCTTTFPRLGFDLLSYPDRLFPPQISADILNFALNHQLLNPAKDVGLLGSFGLDTALPRVLEHKTGW